MKKKNCPCFDRCHQQWRCELVASIPFHLAEDLQVFLQDESAAARKIKPGKSVGGLLLLHPLCIASKLSIVPPRLQDYTRECLEWIATNMGIGQASLLTKVRQTYLVMSRGLWGLRTGKRPMADFVSNSV